MAIARTFSTLNLYDLLANLIPGITLTFVFIVLYPTNWGGINLSSSSGIFVGSVVVFGFVVGHVIQALGSKLDGIITKLRFDGDRMFQRTMNSIENDDEYSPIGKITHIEQSFWWLAKTQFGLTDDFPKSARLLQLVLSYLETRPATRALRFQAIHTFHRSMWVASLLSFLFAAIAGLANHCGWIRTNLITIVIVVIGSLLGMWVFYTRKNKFERSFVKYVFLDYYQDRKAK